MSKNKLFDDSIMLLYDQSLLVSNIKIENLYGIDGIKLNETMMFTKSFLRDELGLSNLDNLFLIKVN